MPSKHKWLGASVLVQMWNLSVIAQSSVALGLAVTRDIQSGVFREDRAVKLTFILRPKASHAKVKGHSIPGRANNKCRAPEMEVGLAYCRSKDGPCV